MDYFDRHIQRGLMFGHKLSRPRAANAQQWIERLENELSPENLSGDGELPRSEVNRRRVELTKALDYARSFLPGQITNRPVLGDPFHVALQVAQSSYRRDRTQQRERKLIAAVQDGFTVGARVLISNGTTGTIIKINRTRVKVKGDDQRLWSVPPRCMSLLRGALR